MNNIINNMYLISAIIGSVVAILVASIRGMRRHYKNKYRLEMLEEKAKNNFDIHLLRKKNENLRGNNENEEVPLRQEEKLVYVKYLHIRKLTDRPIYRKYIPRLKKSIAVHSEYNYFRFNKFNSNKNEIMLSDNSSGTVELNILYPWQDVIIIDKPSLKNPHSVNQLVGGSDTYYSVSTYYNGFTPNNEDIALKVEMDTDCARIIADFSSVAGFEKLFKSEPVAYKWKRDNIKVPLLGLQKINDGIYHLEVKDLKKGEALLLDFEVNWDYLE